MKSTIRIVLVCSLAGIVFAGCSATDILSKFAASDVEMGAQEEYNQAKIIEAKKATIEKKKSSFTDIAELKNVSESSSVAFAFRKKDGKTTQIDIEAMLPNPDRLVYEVWLRGSGLEKIDLGSLKYNQNDDYSLTFTTDEDLTGKNSILISKEAVLDDKSETIIMTGAFGSASPAATPLTTSTP